MGNHDLGEAVAVHIPELVVLIDQVISVEGEDTPAIILNQIKNSSLLFGFTAEDDGQTLAIGQVIELFESWSDWSPVKSEWRDCLQQVQDL